MADYEDAEQFEKLKAFWDENGRWMISAVVLSTAGIFGWNWWKGEQQRYAEGASQVFAQAVTAAEASDLTMLVSHHSTLAEEFPDSPYRSQAGLRLAGLYMQRGDTEEAEATLRNVLERERGSLLEPIAASRLARVLAYRNAHEAALEVLDTVGDGGEFAPLIAEARGDIHAALGDADAARAAYQAAIDNPGQPQLIDVRLVEMKLADLGSASTVAADSP